MTYPAYTIAAETANGAVEEAVLHAQVVAAGPFTEAFDGLLVSGGVCTLLFASALPIPEQAALDLLVAAHTGGLSLDDAKRLRRSEIDRTTKALIDRDGFVYSGSTYSLKTSSVHALALLYAAKDDTGTSYPVAWNTLDNLGTLSLVNAAAVSSFYLAAKSALRLHRDQGNAIKNLVDAATTVSDVQAVPDSRLAYAISSGVVNDYSLQTPGELGDWSIDEYCIGVDHCFLSSNVTSSGGNAVLTAQAGVTDGAQIATTATQLYGSFKAEIQTTSVVGTISAFLYYFDDTNEIDMEILSGDITGGGGKIYFVVHPNTGPESVRFIDLGFDPSAAFHEYRFDWYIDRVEFFVDELLVGFITANIPNTAGSVILNHWSNGDPEFSGGPPASDAAMLVRKTSLYPWQPSVQ